MSFFGRQNQAPRRAVPGTAMLAASVALLLFVVFSGLWVFAWFSMSKNADVGAVTMGTAGAAELDAWIREGGEGEWTQEGTLSFDGFYPGAAYARLIQLKLFNTGDTALTLSLGLTARVGGALAERPVIRDGRYYYFGTQICAGPVRVTDEAGTELPLDGASVGGGCLIPTAPAGSPPETSLPGALSEREIPETSILADYRLAAGSTVIVEVTFVFVDNGDAGQNVYRAFGADADALCLRRFYLTA